MESRVIAMECENAELTKQLHVCTTKYREIESEYKKLQSKLTLSKGDTIQSIITYQFVPNFVAWSFAEGVCISQDDLFNKPHLK